MSSSNLRSLSILAAAALCVVGLCAWPAVAEVVELTDGNSKVLIDPQSDEGMYAWIVDGTDHMAKQWFWYRLDEEGEKSIDTLNLNNVVKLTPAYVKLTYTAPQFLLEIQYILTGGTPGDGYSDVAEIIRIKNTSADTLDLHFFQYCDMDLANTPDNDTLRIEGGTLLNTAAQADEYVAVSETAAAWAPNKVEANLIDPPGAISILDRLNDAGPTDLQNLVGPVGPGNVAWAFQWDFQIAPGDSRIFSKNKVVVPEPAALSVLALGGLVVLVKRRRRRA